MVRGIILFSLILLFSCKSKKELTQSQDLQTVDHECLWKSLKADQILSKIDSSAIDFKCIKINTDVHYEKGDQKEDFEIGFRIVKDSLVYGTVSKVNIPVARFLIKKDSLFAVDLIHKKFIKSDYAQVDSMLGIHLPIKAIENLLLGQPTVLWNEEFYQASSTIHYLKNDSLGKYEEVLDFNCQVDRLNSFYVIDPTSKMFVARYYDQEDINGFVLNKKIEIVGGQGDKASFLLNLNITRVKLFDSLSIPFEIPSDYEEMGKN